MTDHAKQHLALILLALLLALLGCTSPSPSPTPVQAAPGDPLPPPLHSSSALTPPPALHPSEAAPTPDLAPQAGEPTPAAEAVPPSEATPAPPTPEPAEHIVQPGESLLGLAQDHNVPMAAIQLASNLGEQTALMSGQTVRIPSPAGWENASPYWLLHEVKTGDTLSGIATNHSLSIADIQAANHLAEGELLAIGQYLFLPFTGPEGIHAQAPPLPPTSTPAPVALAGKQASTDTTPAPQPTPLPPPSDIGEWQRLVYQLINDTRAQHGLFPLAYKQQLAWAAQLHAQDCQNRGWCSHTGSDGASTAARIGRTGYAASGTAECWVKIDSPHSAVFWWMDEAPPNDAHRRTLLTSYMTEVGVGIVATDWGYYFIADFGRPQ